MTNMIFGLAAYRILLTYSELEQLGLLSLVAAVVSAGQIGNISGTGALARYIASNESNTTRIAYIHTTVILLLVVLGTIALLLYSISDYLITRHIDHHLHREARTLAPVVLVNLILLSISNALYSGIDGLHRADKRAYIGILASLVFILFATLLIPAHGIIGFSLAQASQFIFANIVAYIVLKKHIPGLSLFKIKFDLAILKETLAYGTKIQFISLTNILMEPFIRILIGQASGLTILGYYEIASRLVMQSRSLIVALFTPTIPKFSSIKTLQSPEFNSLVRRTSQIAVIISLIYSGVVLISAPLASIFFFNEFNSPFLAVFFILTVSWSINALGIPIYLAAQARGIMRWNIVSHILVAFVTLFFNLYVIENSSTITIVLSVALGLAIGTSINIIGNLRDFGMLFPLRPLVANYVFSSTAIIIFGLMATYILNSFSPLSISDGF